MSAANRQKKGGGGQLLFSFYINTLAIKQGEQTPKTVRMFAICYCGRNLHWSFTEKKNIVAYGEKITLIQAFFI